LQDARDTSGAKSGLLVLSRATPVQDTSATSTSSSGVSAPRSRAVRVAGGAGIGLLLGLALALLLERIDTKLRTREAAELAFVLPVVAEIPPVRRSRRRRHEVLTASKPTSPVAEAYRSLRTALLLMPTQSVPRGGDPTADDARLADGRSRLEARRRGGVANGTKVILVTSPGPAEGKSVTVANLAASLAESGRSVLVLSFDLRRPDVHHYLG